MGWVWKYVYIYLIQLSCIDERMTGFTRLEHCPSFPNTQDVYSLSVRLCRVTRLFCFSTRWVAPPTTTSWTYAVPCWARKMSH